MPNLLLNSNRTNIPKVDILSGLENRQPLKSSPQIRHKKIWVVFVVLSLLIGIIFYVQMLKIDNLQPSMLHDLAGFFNLSTDKERAKNNVEDANKPLLLQKSIAEKTPLTMNVNEIETPLESSAVLVEVPAEREKITSINTLSPDAKDAAQVVAISNETPVSLATEKSPSASKRTSTLTPSHKQHITTKQYALAKQSAVQKTNKEVKKMSSAAEKTDTKIYDGDIALLSALVANSSKSKEQIPSHTASFSNANKNSPPAINLDVVERHPGDHTRNLLSRCEKLGGAEARLCHERICSGSAQSESLCLEPKG
jgi:hypothetical protein